ncbi:MAG: sel1 repeat family protein [Desulfarculales bacterium]|jgi:TPR repeat protein|nr:sel1 repeat family protein [Desulfarculales bacterium]
MKRLSLLLLLVVLTASGCAGREIMQDNYVKGTAAYDEDYPVDAFILLKPAADWGNPNAQYLIATMYDFGRGLRVDHEEANVWYLRAAQEGQDDAQYNLAISYKRGEGIEQDDAMAIYWLGRAAAQGDQDALGVLEDYADNGESEAQYAMARIYRDGASLHPGNPSLYPDEEDDQAITPDPEQYLYWLNLAAEQGHPEAIKEAAAVEAALGKGE